MEFESENFRNQHGQRLSQHGALRFDSPDAPSDNAESVDHGGMRIRADHRIGISARGAVRFLDVNDRRDVLDIHLMHDADVRRHGAEILKCLLPPLEEHVSLAIAFQFAIGIETECFGSSELIHLNRVIDDQIHLLKRIDLLRIAAHFPDHIAHGGQIDDGRNSREILHQHAGGTESDFLFRRIGE